MTIKIIKSINKCENDFKITLHNVDTEVAVEAVGGGIDFHDSVIQIAS